VPDYLRGASNINRRQPEFALRAYISWIDDVESVIDELRANVKNIPRNVKHLSSIATKFIRDQVLC